MFPEVTNERANTERNKKSSILPDAITKIELSETQTATDRSAKVMQFFGNVDSENFTETSETIIFNSDGKATKTLRKSGKTNGRQRTEIKEKHTANFRKERFLKLAEILVEYDFLNVEDSEYITSMPLKRELKISYSDSVIGLVISEKRIELGHGGEETAELEAILKGFELLQKEIDWKKL
jgi:hypothetical protein